MNQRDLFAAVQKKSGVALKDVKSVIEAFFETVTKTSKKEPVRTTLGTFVVAKRAARMGRNPQTGEAIKIAASKKFRFRPSKSTKEAVMYKAARLEMGFVLLPCSIRRTASGVGV